MNRMLVAAAAILAIGAGQAATAANNARAQFVPIYAKMDRAMRNRQWDVMRDLSTPDFTMVMSKDHVLTVQQAIENMKTQFAMVKSIKTLRSTILSAKIHGKTATIMASGLFEGTIADPQGKLHKMRDTSVSRDTWVRGSHGWLCKSTVNVKDTLILDGKRVTPSGM